MNPTHPSISSLRRLLLVLAALLSAFTIPALAAAADDQDLWYVLEIGGQRAGWMHATRTTRDDRIVSETETTIEIGRGPTGIKIILKGEAVETLDGRPVSMKKVEQLGKTPVTTEFVFGPDGKQIEVRSSQNGQETVTNVAAPEGEWLMPAEAEEFMSKRIAAGATKIEVRSMEPLMAPQPIVTTHKVLERTTVEALGRTVPAVKWTSTLDLQPGIESTEYVDERGVAIRSETSLGSIKIVIILADRDLAMSKLDPPELMVSTLVHPDRPIEDPRNVTAATFLLSSEGGIGDIPDTGVQRPQRISENEVRVVVDLTAARPAPETDASDPSYLASSAMISRDDPVVARLAREATEKLDGDKPARAEAMRAFVYDHINKKNLGVGFATASEVARTRVGDCSEHGVLLAALLRADGIPARVASGLIYADGFVGERAIFGYHMWAQALLEVDGKLRWVDFDGTLPSSIKFDATHIALAVTTLADGESVNGMVALAPLLGKLKINVEETRPAE